MCIRDREGQDAQVHQWSREHRKQVQLQIRIRCRSREFRHEPRTTRLFLAAECTSRRRRNRHCRVLREGLPQAWTLALHPYAVQEKDKENWRSRRLPQVVREG